MESTMSIGQSIVFYLPLALSICSIIMSIVSFSMIRDVHNALNNLPFTWENNDDDEDDEQFEPPKFQVVDGDSEK